MTEKTLDSDLADLADLTDVQRELFEAACAVRPCELAEIDSVSWELARRFEWPFYVHEAVRHAWHSLPIEARLAAYIAGSNESLADEDRSADRFDREFRD